MFLTSEQRQRYGEFQEFAAANVAPFAAEWDRRQEIPESAIKQLGGAGYLGACVPPEYGGRGWDVVTFGLLNEALGHADSAFTGIVTVQSMICSALLKWGTVDQREKWLPPLARGELVGAFAMTEAAGGSDINAMASQFRNCDNLDALVLNGEKKWITNGQRADVFLVFGKEDQRSLASLVLRESAGFEIEPIKDLMGFRAAGLARLCFHEVLVPTANIIGKRGFGLSHVAQVGLQFGRISTACSALGLLRACFEASTGYAASRNVGGQNIGELGVIRSLIARMGADLEAARQLCWSACRASDERLPEAFIKALIAKYFTSRAVVQAASDAVQLHGAAGCHESLPLARFYRGAKIMEIIEGTTQVHESILGTEFVRGASRRQQSRAQAAIHESLSP
jgi:alkylation response protein AidB-like acyl-CoA dehydrogenase